MATAAGYFAPTHFFAFQKKPYAGVTGKQNSSDDTLAASKPRKLLDNKLTLARGPVMGVGILYRWKLYKTRIKMELSFSS